MRVAFLDPLEARLHDFPARYLPAPEFDVLVAETRGVPPDGWQSADAAVWWETPLDRAMIEQMPNLCFLQRIGWFRARGDAGAALERGIPVAVTPHGVGDRVAQHALLLTLMLLRRMPDVTDALQTGRNPDRLEERPADSGQNTVNWARLEGIQSLNDKTIGILGFGEIGAALARMLSVFHTRTLAYRRRPLSSAQEAFYHVTAAPLGELLRESDVVVSFVPGIPEASGLMGAREFGLMKPAAYFVNCGRALHVDEAALLDALRSGHIAGAGLDVYPIEPLPQSSPLRSLPNVVLTPHSAGGIGGWTDTFARLRSNLDKVRASRGQEVQIALRPGDYQPGVEI